MTLEENVKQGGFGIQVEAYIHEHHPEVKVVTITLPDKYVEHGDVTKLRAYLGIDSDSIIERLRQEGVIPAGDPANADERNEESSAGAEPADETK